MLGLDPLDHLYLKTLGTVYRGGPAGLETIAATMNEDAGTLEDVVEPYLLQIGFLARTRRGSAHQGRVRAHRRCVPGAGRRRRSVRVSYLATSTTCAM